MQFKVQDQINNLGTGPISQTYYYDGLAPESGDFTINNGESFTNNPTTTLFITQPTDAGVQGIEIGYSNYANPTNWTTLGSSFLHTLSRGQGQKDVYVGFRDAVHNTTTDYTHAIVLDTVAPLLPRQWDRSRAPKNGSKNSSIIAVQEDSEGNTYAVGKFESPLYIDEKELTSSITEELFINKYNKK